MTSIDSSGAKVSIPDNESTWIGDFDPYAYPYFNADHHSVTVYDLVVRFGRQWREDACSECAPIVKRIQDRCRAHPKEVQWKDSCGDTALHRLSQIARLPSHTTNKTQYFLDICQSILEVHPYATIATNNWKETPLHQFSSHCGHPSKFPLQATDTKISTESNPIFAFFFQLTRHGAASCKNWWESYALHDACNLPGFDTGEPRTMTRPLVVSPYETWLQTIHLKIIEHLLQTFPLSLHARDDSGLTPLDRAAQSCTTSSYVVRRLVQELLLEEQQGRGKFLLTKQSPLMQLVSHYFDPSNISPKNSLSNHIVQQLNSDRLNPCEIARQLGSLWTNTVLLCAAQVYGTVSPISRLTNPLLHALVQTEAPYCCIQLAIKLYPNELKQINEAGETALTLSILGKGCYERDEPTQTSWRVLLEAEPKLASMANIKGQLPLQIAISKQMLTWDDGLREIFAANPYAITARDVVTGLYPFLQAATVGDASSSFELLRADPSVLMMSYHAS